MNPDKKESIFMEIRAGTGGDEAALFVGDLFRMYSKYAQSQNWEKEILDSKPKETGGFREIIFELSNGNVWKKLKWEAGVHRVQRIPETEKRDRVHTSTVTVAVLKKPDFQISFEINPKDLKIETFRASGPGGQYLQKRETAVRITHLPTGITTTSQVRRNQAQNKELAMNLLRAKLLQTKKEKLEKELQKERKSQIGGAERSEKIRTYNFPQNRLTDHRVKKSWHNLEEIIEGKLEKIIKVLGELDIDK